MPDRPAAVRHLTVQDLADRLVTTVAAIYVMNSRGTGPRILRPTGSKRGRILYRLVDVEAWEESRVSPRGESFGSR